jgi:Zn-dependent peptidase ImmA (M78 family)
MSTSLKDKITASRKLLQNPYAYLDDTGSFDAAPDGQLATGNEIYASRCKYQNPYSHLNDAGGFDAIAPEKTRGELQPTSPARMLQFEDKHYAWIEKKVHGMQAFLWKKRHQLWSTVPENPISILEPKVALNSIGFDFDLEETLGQIYVEGKKAEVAGVIDRSAKRVQISRQFPYNIRRFTAAHELGHAILHDTSGLHRDRPLDGTNRACTIRDKTEIEADKFATYFLMPKRLVRKRFKQVFGCDTFTLNQDTAFALDPSDTFNLEKTCKTMRDLSRILAKTEAYNGQRFHSLGKQFGVTTEAMAIRLEELGLVNFSEQSSI